MKEPEMKLSFGAITITEKAKQLVNQALESTRVSQGKLVAQLEDKFAEIVGVKEAVAVSSGTDADTIALAVLHDWGAKRGDEVIVPALSFVATGNSVIHAGFKPVFVDVERYTLNINPLEIEKRITERTRAIMPVHLMGKPADMDAIMAIAFRHKLHVVEDAAEAHGAKYRNRNVGGIGHMGAFSLYVAHIISSIEGGMITTNDKAFAEAARSLRAHGRYCSCKRCINLSGKKCEKRFTPDGKDQRFMYNRIGYSSKMNELEAAVGLGTLDIYDEILKVRLENLRYLLKEFKRFAPVLETFSEQDYEVIGPHAFPIILGKGARFTREQYSRFLNDNGIDTRDLFASIPTQYPSFSLFGYKLGDFPEAEYIGNNGIHIGVHQDLKKEHLDYFLSVTERFLQQHS